MKKFNKLAVIASVVGVLGVGSFSYAATTTTPAGIASGLTGKTVESLQEERATGKTYGEIAKDAGKLDEFKAQMLDQKIAVINERVKAGTITQEQADQIINEIKENQANCEGTGSKGIGKKHGIGFGKGNGMGQGKGAGQGMRNGQGNGYSLNK